MSLHAVSLVDDKPVLLSRRSGTDCTGCDDHQLPKHHSKRASRPALPQQLDRAYAEIIQEVRVAQTGVQVLLAFVLTLAFTPRFALLSTTEQSLYVITLVLGAAATALLMGPAAFHRVVYRQRLRRHLVLAANRFAACGLAVLVAAKCCAILLILEVVTGTFTIAGLITGGVLAWFALNWLVFPLWCRYRHGRRRDLELARGQRTRSSAETPVEMAA
jgi:Family of unknown function (DUF6328)